MTVSGDTSAQDELCWTPAIGQLIDLALQEDLGAGDVTTRAVGASGAAIGTIISRQPLICCGLPVAEWIVARTDAKLRFESHTVEGDRVEEGTVLACIYGGADAILRVERVVLNFVMRLCGVATLTKRYADAISDTGARIVDTRKTLPGWRVLDKYAVRMGGGCNHRFDLGSGILIKDNHIAACGSVGEAVRRARTTAPHPLRIEVEVESLSMVDEALAAHAEILLLDNMSVEEVHEAVARIDGRALIEVSGGVTLQTVRGYAEAGVDLISVGALTHSVPAVDISLALEGTG